MNKTVVFNPDYYFIEDEDRISLRSSRSVAEISNASWLSFIHPFQAYVLSMFSKGADINSVSELISQKYDIDKITIENILQSYLNNKEPIYTTFKGRNILFPKNILVNYDKTTLNKKAHRDRSIMLEKYLGVDIDLTTDRIKVAPRSLLFMITNKCKTSCGYCYANISKKYSSLSIEQIKHFIMDAKQAGVEYIDIIGGEIFCHEKWDEILSLLVELNMCPSYISTKVPLTEDEIVRLKHTGFNGQFQVSLDSINDESLSKIICVPRGYSDRMKKSIFLLRKYGFNIQINTVLTNVNSNLWEIDLMHKFISTIDEISYWEIRVPEVSIYNLSSYKKTKPDRNRLIKCLDYIRETVIATSKFKILISDSALHMKFRSCDENCTFFPGGSCGVLKENMFVLPDGQVGVCEQLYWMKDFLIGDIKFQSIQEIWSSDKALNVYSNIISFYQKSQVCSKCALLQQCAENKRKCWVKVIKGYNTLSINHPDPRCIYAPLPEIDNLTYSN